MLVKYKTFLQKKYVKVAKHFSEKNQDLDIFVRMLKKISTKKEKNCNIVTIYVIIYTMKKRTAGNSSLASIEELYFF